MDLQDRVAELEAQVKGLMETVTQMRVVHYSDRLGVPRPDQYTDNKMEAGPRDLILKQASKAQKVALRAGRGVSLGDKTDTNSAQGPAERSTATSTPPAETDISKLEPYEYSPLEVQSRQIRYIEFEASNDRTGPIRISLSATSLANFPANTPASEEGLWTLSYQWGDPSDPEPIVVNGKMLHVTRNLHKALLYFRDYRPDGPASAPASHRFSMNARRMWWIDAICINQQDLDEKNSQVRLMTAIYRGSQVVHVWLGEEADDSKRAMNVIRKLSRKPSAREWEESNYVRRSGQKVRYVGPGIDPEELPEDPVPTADSEKEKNYQSIVKLMSRKYFSRVWIRQEITLPRTVKFHCGNQSLMWDEFMDGVSIMAFLADDHCLPNLQRLRIRESGSVVSIFRRVEELRHLRTYFDKQRNNRHTEGQYFPLRGLLFHARNSDATDNRDKVYAMLPLVSPDDFNFEIDYRKPYREIYKEVALDLARTSVNFFSACQNKGNYGLPSWVPDFSKKWDFLPLIMSFESPEFDKHDWRDSKPRAEYIAAQSALRIPGIVFDEIATISDAVADSDDLSRPTLQSLLDVWSEFIFAERSRLFAVIKANPPPGARNPNDWSGMDSRIDPYRGFNDLKYKRTWTVWQFFNDNSYGSSLFSPRGSSEEFAAQPLGRTVQDTLMTTSLAAEMEAATRHQKSGSYQGASAKARSLFVGRKMAGTKLGGFGLLPGSVQVGDRIAQFQGSSLTYIVRQRGDETENRWSLLGDAWFLSDIGGAQSRVDPMKIYPPRAIQSHDIV